MPLDLVPNSAEYCQTLCLGSCGRRRVVEVPIEVAEGTRKDRTSLFGPVADPDHAGEVLPPKSDVRGAAVFCFPSCQSGKRTALQRVRRNLWPHLGHLGVRAVSGDGPAVRSWCLYHKRILVHGFNFLCQSCGHACAVRQRYVCRDSAAGRSRIHRCPTWRGGGSHIALSLARAPASEKRTKRPCPSLASVSPRGLPVPAAGHLFPPPPQFTELKLSRHISVTEDRHSRPTRCERWLTGSLARPVWRYPFACPVGGRWPLRPPQERP